MAYLRPPAFQRAIFNRLAMRFGIGGAVTLEVPRRSGKGMLRIPVIPVESGGSRYLVSPRGEAHWVRNLRAANGAGTLVSKGKAERFASTEVPVAERDAILDDYRKKAGKVVEGYFKQLPNAEDHPVFRIER